ncbi:MAG: T9SS type A sorting domain-containing protein [Bacteroidia bacterium]|nr:T9SS type A sorting domain-containing protein [Bacteroidia bacterium]
MKTTTLKLALCFFALASAINLKADKSPASVYFQENKGQIHDQNFNPRPDVLFSGNTNGLYYHLKHTGLSYQLLRIDEFKTVLNSKTTQPQKQVAKQTVYRIDIDWLNANPLAQVVKSNELEGSENFYSDVCPNGIADVKTYQQVVYKNIYSGTDLKWYHKDGSLEYDFIVHPNADYHNIEMKINGAYKISINTKGELEIVTPLGTIIEKAPVAYQGSTRIDAQWRLNDEVVSFEIGQYNKNLALVIDPSIRVWGTYYGSTSDDESNETCLDNSGNVYMVGTTASNAAIATVGAHQTTISTTTDAFISKFTSAGVRLWATYYGSTGADAANACITDATGNIYVVGNTTATNSVLATTGAYQVSPYGGGDGFVVKFNASGVRQWGSYYGDFGGDYLNDIGIDNAANVYLAGASGASFSLTISTAGSHQVNNGGGATDAFLVKFNTSGTRQWATFYGGTGADAALGCFVEPAGGVFISGNTASTGGTSIATVGSHQPAHGGGTNDAFLAYFNTSGVRQWGTYYGATGNDFGTCIAKDGAGFVYMGGYASSGSAIATVGAHQTTHGGNTNDGILIKFNSTGVRQWGTYYGGTGNDFIFNIAINTVSNRIYITGASSMGGNIATINGFQTVHGGGLFDAFLVSFIPSGVRQIGTYYGGTGNFDDQGTGCVTDANGNVYITGRTTSATGLSTPGAHQTAFGAFGNNDGFLVKFQDCSSTFSTALNSATICSGQSVNLLSDATGVTSYSWSNGATTSSVSVSPTVTTNYTITANTATAQCFYVKIITVSVTPSPTVNIAGTSTLCAGNTVTLTASGANTYSWSTSATTASTSINPTITTTYSVIGTNTTTGCSTTSIRTVTVTAAPSVTLTASSPTTCSNGNSITLTASGATTYSWSTGQTTNTIILFPGFAPTYNYTVTGTSLGCTNTKTITINVITTPTVTVSANPNIICTGNTTTITATGATTYSWNTSATTNSISVSPTVTTTYSVVGYNGACSNTRTITITNNTPNVNLSTTSSTICSGSTVTLSASGASTYSWNTSSTSSSISVSPTISTNYTVTGTTSGCTNTKTIAINVTTSPTVITSASSNTICTGNTTTITATGATTYSWNTTATTSSITVSPTVTTTYTVTGVNGSCSDTKTVTITNNTPNLNVSATSTNICTGGTATLTASGATTYSWNTSATTAAINVSPTSSTTYTVTGTTGACSTTSTIPVNVTSAINLNIASTMSVSCSGAPVVLTASGASTYTWNTGPNTTTISVSPTSSTNYTVTGTSGTCNGSTVITIGASTNPTVNSITSSSLICSLPTQQSATLTASGATTYSWNTGATTAAITVSPGITTTYTVTGYNAQGCMNTSIITQSVSLCTGVDELNSANEIIIFPNPSNGEFTVKGVNGNFEIINSIGQTIYISDLNDSEEVKITSLAQGIYYLKIKDSKVYKKIVVVN